MDEKTYNVCPVIFLKTMLAIAIYKSQNGEKLGPILFMFENVTHSAYYEQFKMSLVKSGDMMQEINNKIRRNK